MLFGKPSQVEYIIVGLGNPGKKYEGTRHNVGFEALDHAAGRWGIRVDRSKFDALTGAGAVAGHKVLLMKPQTFMNASGVAVHKAAAFYKVDPGHVIVLADDVSLAPGVLRLREKGSAGGHNGLKSIITFLGEAFPRVKIGVGAKPRPEYDLADWVLGKPDAAARRAIDARRDDVAGALELLVQGEFALAQSRYNGGNHDEER